MKQYESIHDKNKSSKIGLKEHGKIFLILIILQGAVLGILFWLNKPTLFEVNFDENHATEEFTFSTSDNLYYIGFIVNMNNFKNKDINYTFEYYRNNEFERKELINIKTIQEYYPNGLGAFGEHYDEMYMSLGKIKKEGKYKVKITAHNKKSMDLGFTNKDVKYFYFEKPSKLEKVKED